MRFAVRMVVAPDYPSRLRWLDCRSGGNVLLPLLERFSKFRDFPRILPRKIALFIQVASEIEEIRSVRSAHSFNEFPISPPNCFLLTGTPNERSFAQGAFAEEDGSEIHAVDFEIL